MTAHRHADCALHRFIALLALTSLLLLAAPSIAQQIKEEDLPREVMVTFRKNFPVIAVEAYRSDEGNYQLSFRADGADRVYLYSETGRLLVMRVVSEDNKMPPGLLDHVYAIEGAEVLRVFRTRTSKSHFWELLIRNGTEEMLLRFSVPDGQNMPFGDPDTIPLEAGKPLPRI